MLTKRRYYNLNMLSLKKHIITNKYVEETAELSALNVSATQFYKFLT